MDFEFNQLFCDPHATPTNCEANGVNPSRMAGDMLFDFDFGGSGQPALTLHKWIDTGSASLCEANNTLPCWDKASAHTADLNNNYQASVNGGPVNDYNAPVPSAGFNILAGETKTTGNGANQKTTISSTFGEAGVNLTDSEVFPEDECVHFGSASLKSRSSGESFTSELKDFIAPIPVNISNCGQVIIRKVTDPAGDEATDFDYTTDVETDDGTAPGFSLKDGESNTIDNVLQGGYNVTEDLVQAASDNYTLTDIDCDDSTVPDANIAIDVSAGTVDFDIAPDETLDCTYTNTKNLNNPSGSSSPSVIPQDSVTVSDLDNTGDPDGAADGKMTFELWDDVDCEGNTGLQRNRRRHRQRRRIDTSNTGRSATTTTATTITADGTFYWKIHYNGDDRNNPFDIDCG